MDKTVDRNDRALSLAIWDLGVRFFKLRRRDEAQFAIMRRMHRLPTSPESRFWKQAIDIDFEANHFHPALGCRMTVSGTEEVCSAALLLMILCFLYFALYEELLQIS